MIRPNVRVMLKTLTVAEVINELERFITSTPESEYYLANIDLLRLYGKSLQVEKFYKLAFYLTSQINNPAIYREVARFSYFIEKDTDKGKIYAEKAINENKNEPLWVYYIARKKVNYFEKIYDGIFLTAIPKNASTSLKTMVLEHLHNKKGLNPHSVFGNPFFKTNFHEFEVKEGDLKLLSIREPISRFLSYYNKNIIEESSLKEELHFTDKVAEFGLSLKPSLSDFVRDLNKYCYMFNDVLHHILPQTAYFHDIDIFNNIAELNSSNLLAEAVSNKTGVKLFVPNKMVSSKKIDNITLKEETKNEIKKLYKDDIEFFHDNATTNKKYSFNFGD